MMLVSKQVAIRYRHSSGQVWKLRGQVIGGYLVTYPKPYSIERGGECKSSIQRTRGQRTNEPSAATNSLMPLNPLSALSESGLPPLKFWSDDLELPLQRWASDLRWPEAVDICLKKLTGRQIAVLCNKFGIDDEQSVHSQREALAAPQNRLIPYFLVERFGKFKSSAAIRDAGLGVLDDNSLADCQISDDEYDGTALLFAIFSSNWADLPLVLHLDRVHKTGFARMKLSSNVRKRAKGSLAKFLTLAKARELLKAFDRHKRDGRFSELKNVLVRDAHQVVFIRRAERPERIVQGDSLVHGFRPEWIILDFFSEAKRVNISSRSVSVPLEIANCLASSYFGTECEYENECRVTTSQQLKSFLSSLRNRKVDAKDQDALTLVEIVFVNSPLSGAPTVKISDAASMPIGPALKHFEKSIGSIVRHVDRIESIKVLFRKKRVSLIFEKLTKDSLKEFVVSYSDHRLNAQERVEFEEHVRKEHEIKITSTEKRHRRDS